MSLRLLGWLQASQAARLSYSLQQQRYEHKRPPPASITPPPSAPTCCGVSKEGANLACARPSTLMLSYSQPLQLYEPDMTRSHPPTSITPPPP